MCKALSSISSTSNNQTKQAEQQHRLTQWDSKERVSALAFSQQESERLGDGRALTASLSL